MSTRHDSSIVVTGLGEWGQGFGVVRHTPLTRKRVRELARVSPPKEPRGTACPWECSSRPPIGS
jgi:hypothetical protein